MRESARLIIRILGLALIVGALALIGYAAYNLLDAEFGTAASLAEAEALVAGLYDDIDKPQNDDNPTVTPPPGGPPPEPTDPTRTGSSIETSEGGESTEDRDGNVMGVMVLESLGSRKVPLIAGASARDLSRGAGHHPRSSQPGQVGNSVIYGHRNTVFRGFGKLEVGDRIRVELPDVTYHYEIESMKVIDPDNKQIFKAYDYAAMTLVTCYPFHNIGPAPQRYLVICKLVA